MNEMRNLKWSCDNPRYGCYRESLWDWTPMNDCFGDSGIRISDVDGIVERNGCFLLLDGKRVNDRGERHYSDGQWRLYVQFAKHMGHVILFHGKPPDQVEYVREWLPGGEYVPERECDLDQLNELISAWYVRADSEEQ
jgi:hypothetical protein